MFPTKRYKYRLYAIPRLLPQNEIWNIFDVSVFFNLSSWIDWYLPASENWFNGWKVNFGIIKDESSSVATLEWNFKRFWCSHDSRFLSWTHRYTVCETRLNGSKVIVGGKFLLKFPGCSLQINFLACFYVVFFFHLFSWKDQYTVCKNQLNDWKAVVGVNFYVNSPVATLE